MTSSSPSSGAGPLTLTTPRLLLSAPRLGDAPEILRSYASDAQVTRYLVWTAHGALHETEAFISRCLEGLDAGRSLPFVIRLHPGGELIGMIELRLSGHKADLGYVLSHAHWGRGYATEALRAAITHAWTLPGMARLWATCDVDNRASARVLEKAGMLREGLLRAWEVHPACSSLPRDSWCYAMTR